MNHLILWTIAFLEIVCIFTYKIYFPCLTKDFFRWWSWTLLCTMNFHMNQFAMTNDKNGCFQWILCVIQINKDASISCWAQQTEINGFHVQFCPSNERQWRPSLLMISRKFRLQSHWEQFFEFIVVCNLRIYVNWREQLLSFVQQIFVGGLNSISLIANKIKLKIPVWIETIDVVYCS